MNKEILRELYKQKRKELSDVEIEVFQEQIYKQVFELDFSAIKTVHIFLSMKKYKEVDTNPIIDFLLQQNINIVTSRCNFDTDTLSHFLFDRNTQLQLNKFGVPEPINTPQVDEKEIDLVFVPLLISDKEKYRVGYGKGFYDRFLSACRDDVKKIGLNFFKPIVKIDGIHQYDVALDKVLYPK
ncbi:5-formyltetrahydrofolate cyclo-ligase [Tenacibaculum sp. UWU-22]|uniref:5-formyltetrahydrofolate cyclo-ligase n=1 Tax=Tenacibaculum sp. UWU-22 TaxID=3234187 RepID=UPI0034DAFC2F